MKKVAVIAITTLFLLTFAAGTASAKTDNVQKSTFQRSGKAKIKSSLITETWFRWYGSSV